MLVEKNDRWKWYFVTKIVLTYCEKKLFEWLRKTFEIRDWRPRIFKHFEITRTIYSNSEWSKQFLLTESFFNLFLEVSHVSKIRKVIIQVGKKYWDLETCRKSWKRIIPVSKTDYFTCFTAKKILEWRGIQTSSLFVKIW